MRTVLVTGGTKGIGLAIAKKFLQDDYFVIMTYASDDLAANKACNELEVLQRGGVLINILLFLNSPLIVLLIV